MGLIERIKSALGLGTSGPAGGADPSSRTDEVDVTVEHEPATASEDAVKGTDTASSGAATSVESEPTESGTVEASSASGGAAETPSTTGTGSESAAADAGDESEATDAGTPEDDSAGADAAESGGESEPTDEMPAADLEDIKGIGPAYAGRLREAGVESVADLAGADIEVLADETDIAASRIENWIERADAY